MPNTPKRRASTAVTRPTRTAVQAGPAVAIVAFIDAFFRDFNEVEFGAAVAFVTVVLSFIQTATENGLGVGFLRDVPDPTDPVPGDAT